MAKTRILFLPWPKEGLGDALYKDALWWNTASEEGRMRKKKHWTIVGSGDSGKPLANLPINTTIWVMGHCSAGSDSLYPHQGLGLVNGLRFDKVCDGLVETGLEHGSRGALKFYNCESALSGPSGESFLNRAGGNLVRDRKFTRCGIFGYRASLFGYTKRPRLPSQPAAPKDEKLHKWVFSFPPKLAQGGADSLHASASGVLRRLRGLVSHPQSVIL